jgi:putative endonuclease
MFYAYVIKSVISPYYYKGHCEDLEKRLNQHNSGMTHSIKRFIPFEIVYFEVFETRQEAISREHYLKSAAGRRFLRSKLSG